MSTAKSLCCLEAAAGTARSVLVTELSPNTSVFCRRPLLLSLLDVGRNTLALFFCGCEFVFLADAAAFFNLTGGVCADEGRSPSAGVSTRCVTFISGVVFLDVVLPAEKSALQIHHTFHTTANTGVYIHFTDLKIPLPSILTNQTNFI